MILFFVPNSKQETKQILNRMSGFILTFLLITGMFFGVKTLKYWLCQSPGPGLPDTVWIGRIWGPCIASVWLWWSRSHPRSVGPSVSPVCPPVRTGSWDCSSLGTRTPTGHRPHRCRRLLRRGSAGCSAAEPWEWATPGAWRSGARAAPRYHFRWVLPHAVRPWFRICFSNNTHGCTAS